MNDTKLWVCLNRAAAITNMNLEAECPKSRIRHGLRVLFGVRGPRQGMLAVVPGRCHSVAVNPFAFLVIFLAGGMNRNPQEVIEYSPEEVGVLKELMGNGTIKGCIIKSSRAFQLIL